jgi:hypothetical protein
VTPLYPQKLALTSPTGGGRSVGIVRSRTKATEFSLLYESVGTGVLCNPQNMQPVFFRLLQFCGAINLLFRKASTVPSYGSAT